jgi:hypothetical protein
LAFLLRRSFPTRYAADLGALNLLIAPFLPTMDAWFSPADNWNYVGGEFDRYFRGPHVLTVRVSPPK